MLVFIAAGADPQELDLVDLCNGGLLEGSCMIGASRGGDSQDDEGVLAEAGVLDRPGNSEG